MFKIDDQEKGSKILPIVGSFFLIVGSFSSYCGFVLSYCGFTFSYPQKLRPVISLTNKPSSASFQIFSLKRSINKQTSHNKNKLQALRLASKSFGPGCVEIESFLLPFVSIRPSVRTHARTRTPYSTGRTSQVLRIQRKIQTRNSDKEGIANKN